ncbi:HAD family hydrolase [Georgenia subflava]|uniref:HAD hydrolase family protein n=1 Tax=Georgenia subflava TaxID=1622177 RepID=A0A6N7EKF7_9MICO|nr:HAD family hydrolase [Georgenia subflava]MPV37035.1 HAD hydrolase family protein [Georgenia subflava]
MNVPEELLDVRAVAFDVDGTLAGTDHRVTVRTLRALADLRAAGVEPIVITGRILSEALAIFAGAGIDGHAVASNGAVAVDTRKTVPLHTATLPEVEARAVVGFCDGRPIEPSLFTADAMVVPEGSLVYDLLREVNPDSTTLAVPRDALPYTSTMKAAIIGEPATLDALDGEIRAAFPRMTRSMDTVFDLSPSDADKWVALQVVLADVGLDPAEVAGVGDGENDLVWLSQVGFPVAMGNARSAVRDLARLHIGHHGEEAVAELVEALLAARTARPA